MVKARRKKSPALSLSMLAVALCLTINKIDALSLRTNPATTFVTRRELSHSDDAISAIRRCSRGGAIDLDVEYDVDEYDSEDDVEVDEDVKLAASAVAAVAKAKKKKADAAKKAMSRAILESKLAMEVKKTKKKKSRSILKKIPYILRAFVNPFTVLAMTKGYFASLFNIDYMSEDASQNLRSALEQKAKKAGPSGGKRAKKMQRGQAKTLSDLPVLNT